MTTSEIREEGLDLRVRRAVAGDWALIVEFNRLLAAESEGLELDLEALGRGVRAVLDDPARGVYFIAEAGGAAVGQVQVTFEWSDWGNGWFWWMQSVYVQPAQRRRGVLRALFDHVTKEASERGDVLGLRLYVVRGNESAIEAYTRLGMEGSEYAIYEKLWTPEGARRETPDG